MTGSHARVFAINEAIAVPVFLSFSGISDQAGKDQEAMIDQSTLLLTAFLFLSPRRPERFFIRIGAFSVASAGGWGGA